MGVDSTLILKGVSHQTLYITIFNMLSMVSVRTLQRIHRLDKNLSHSNVNIERKQVYICSGVLTNTNLILGIS